MHATIQFRKFGGQEYVELYIYSPSMSSWRGAYLSTGTTLPLPHLTVPYLTLHK